MDTVHELLCEVSAGTTALKKATKKCQDITALQKVQTAFLQVTKCDNWYAAEEHYPHFTTAEIHRKKPMLHNRVYNCFCDAIN